MKPKMEVIYSGPTERTQETDERIKKVFDILFSGDYTDTERTERLKTEPKGFPIEADFWRCGICKSQSMNTTGWYDKFGMKCMNYQKAVEKRQIPGSICYHDEKWYSMEDLDTYYDLNRVTVKKLIQEKKLNVRIIRTEYGRVHCYMFLLKDNKGVLQPKPKTIHIPLGNGSYRIEYPKLIFKYT